MTGSQPPGSQTRRQPPPGSPRPSKVTDGTRSLPRGSLRSSLPGSAEARPSPCFQLCRRAVLPLVAWPLYSLFPDSWDAVPFPSPCSSHIVLQVPS